MINLVNKKTVSQPYNQQDWQKGYLSQPNEYDYWIDEIEGEIPPGLEGTMFRNGPGLLDIHGTPVYHPFDGDGMVCAVSFVGGRAHFRNRFVRTEGFVREQKAGKILYRGVFGTQKPGGWIGNAFDFRLKNIANTNVIYWGDRLLALWEAAEPYRLDPHTLETIGLDHLDGVLKPGDAFSAHPRIDPSSHLDGGAPVLVNFSLKVGLSSTVTIYEFNLEGKLLRSHKHIIPGFSFIHDFAITPNYCILFQNPVNFQPLPFAMGWRGAGQCIKFQQNKPTRIIAIPRTPPYQNLKIWEARTGFVFHHANAFESEDKIYVDSICYQSFPEIEPITTYTDVDFNSFPPGQLWRFSLNLKDRSVSREILERRSSEFPATNPDKEGRPYRYIFMGSAHSSIGNGPLQAISKLDLETQASQIWSFAPKGYVSEPIFVPQPGAGKEDEGWILTMVYDSNRHRSSVAILDARDLNRGPIAQLHLKHHVPFGLHGNWVDRSFVKFE